MPTTSYFVSSFFALLRKKGEPSRQSFASHLLLKLFFARPLIKLVAACVGIVGVVLGIVPSLLQKQFVDKLSSGDAFANTALMIAYIGGAFCCSLAFQLLVSLSRLLCARENYIAQGWLGDALYQHTLSLDSRARGKRTVGQIVSLYATDVQAACFVIEDTLPSLIASVIPLLIAPVAVHYIAHIDLWRPILVSLGTVLLCLLLAFRQGGFFTQIKVLEAKRLSIVNEWLQNIRALRVLGWVSSFEERIKEARQHETKNRLKMVTNGSTMNTVMQVAPLLVNVAGVVSLLAARHDTLSPGDIFALLWIFGVFLSRPLRMLPWILVLIIDGSTSARRLEEYFRLPTDKHNVDPLYEKEHREKELLPFEEEKQVGPGVIIENLLLEGKHGTLLDIPFLEIHGGTLVGVVGEVGSGKTLFLQSLLRETWASMSRYEIGEKDALYLAPDTLREYFVYVPQEPFVMSATLRDNVMLAYGTPHHENERIVESLSLAQFSPSHFTEGLDTEIGERGVNLSGGQRQRVNLARAHLHQGLIVVMDDALSALDVTTEAQVRDELLREAWKGTTRILATHRLSILPWCHNILFLKNGRIIAQGAYEELLSSSDEFAEFVQSHTKEEKSPV